MIDDDPPLIAQAVADRVRQRRLDLDLTQRSLARRAGMSLSTYRRPDGIAVVPLALIGP